MLCLAVFQAWRARALATEYQESEHIFRALWVILLVIFIGLPVLIIARVSTVVVSSFALIRGRSHCPFPSTLFQDNPDASIFLTSAIIFVSSCAILLLIFVPKMTYLRRSQREDKPDRIKISGIGQPMGDSYGNDTLPSFKTSSNSTDSETGYGDTIITTKTKRELAKEVAALKRRIHVLEEHRHDGMTQEASPSPEQSAPDVDVESSCDFKEEKKA